MPEAGHESLSGTNDMKNYRTWGKRPYRVAVVHGGPGIPGAVAPVADELSRTIGVLEPLQTKNSLEGQIVELADVLKKHSDIPVVLIAHSWGAFLSLIVASRFPSLVRKLILVAGGPFEEKYTANIHPDTLNRLSEKDRIVAIDLMESSNDSFSQDKKDRSMARLGELFAKAETYAPLPRRRYEMPEGLKISEEINHRVWTEAKVLRVSGEILKIAGRIQCKVVAIHGDYDPRLSEGVREPLSRVLKNFKFILMEKCGHEPWQEKFARDKFFKILKKEIV
jgi:pimeloyl-ACP methyl ester carboxylesterase